MLSFKRFTAILLALVVFISSGGVVLAVHYCSKKTTKDVFLFENKSCCSQQSSNCDSNGDLKFEKKKCCDLKITYHKVDISTVFAEGHHFDLPDITIVNDCVYSFPPNAINIKTSLTNKAPPFYTGGKSFLHISSLLLI